MKMFLAPREAAALLGLSVRALARYRARGRGPVYYKFGASVRYTLEDLRQWAATGHPGRRSGRGGRPQDEEARAPRPR